MTNEITDFLNTDVFGIKLVFLIALVIGLILAYNEGIKLKYKEYSLQEGKPNTKFDRRYRLSGIFAVIICSASVYILFKTGGLIIPADVLPNGDVATFDWEQQIQALIIALIAVFTEASVLIKTINRRLFVMSMTQPKRTEPKVQSGSQKTETKQSSNGGVIKF